MDCRVYQRIEVDGFISDVSDGAGFFPGVISDVSRFGICISDLPRRLNDKVKRMTVVVNGHGKNFKMLVKPRWAEQAGLRKMVGCEIVNTPWEWTDFVMRFESDNNDDVWGVVTL